MPVIKLSQSSSQIQIDRVINGDHQLFNDEGDTSGLGFDSFAATNSNQGKKKKKIKSLTDRIYEGGEGEEQEGEEGVESYLSQVRAEGSGPLRIG